MSPLHIFRSKMNELEHHYSVIDEKNWPRNERRRLKKDLKAIYERDGFIDTRAFDPGYRWNLCATRLRDLDFNYDGWEFRSDWAATFRGFNGFRTKVPLWDGKPVGKLIVLGEQGVGDEILFASALPDLMVRVGKGIEFKTYPRLIPVFERSYRIKCTERQALGKISDGDALVALSDLFPWYRRDQRHFPKKPFLKPDPEKVEFWTKRLRKYGERPKIGIAFHSRHGSVNPEDLKTDNASCPDAKDALYVNLQYQNPDKGRFHIPEWLHQEDIDLWNDIDGTFALVAALDKVHSVTQTIVHIAGSQGKECHAVIPPRNGEANWFLWYHEAREKEHLDRWQHLIYGSVTVYKDIHEFRNRSPV